MIKILTLVATAPNHGLGDQGLFMTARPGYASVERFMQISRELRRSPILYLHVEGSAYPDFCMNIPKTWVRNLSQN